MATSIGASGGGIKARIRRALSALQYKDGSYGDLSLSGEGELWVKDNRIPDLITAVNALEITNTHLQSLIDGIKISTSVKVQTKVVSCPAMPLTIPGIGAGVAYTAGDVMGTIFEIDVPPSGIIYSATLWDLDDENLQIDLEIFKNKPAQIADNAAWSPTDGSMLGFLTEIAFAGFDDHINSRTSEVNIIGKAYSVPNGKVYIQAVTRGAHNIAAGSEPRVQIQIISDDPNYQER